MEGIHIFPQVKTDERIDACSMGGGGPWREVSQRCVERFLPALGFNPDYLQIRSERDEVVIGTGVDALAISEYLIDQQGAQIEFNQLVGICLQERLAWVYTGVFRGDLY